MDKRLALPLILLLAFGLRALGIGFGLPHLYHQDEPMMVNHAMAIGTGDWNTHYFVIPPFVSYFLFFVYAALFVAGRALGRFASPEDFAASFLADPTPFYLAGRLALPVLFGTATVWALYRLGKRHFSERTGLVAALFLALAPIHVQHSHYIYADVPVTLAVVLLFDAMLTLLERSSLKNYLVVGVLLGWGTAVKYTAAYFVPVIVLAHVLAKRRDRDNPLTDLPRLLIAGGVSLIVFAAIAPYTFLDMKSFIATMQLQAAGESFVGWGHHLIYSLANGLGPLVLAMAVVGLLFAFRISKRKALVLITGCAVFYLVNTVFSQHYARYILPAVPLVCLFAAIGWEVKPKAVILILAVLSLAIPSFWMDALFRSTDTRTEALRWFEQNVPEKSVVAVDNRFFGPPLLRDPASFGGVRETLEEEGLDRARRLRIGLLEKITRGKKTYVVHALVPGGGASANPEFALSGPFVEADPAQLDSAGVRYIVFNFADFSPEVHGLRGALGEEWERVHWISPYWRRGRLAPLDPHATTAGPHTWMELFNRTRLGPALEIWRKKS